jgi:hypothetical protein
MSEENEVKEAIEMFGFEKNQKSRDIPLKLLKQSIRVEDNLGRAYRTRPVQAWTLMAMILSMVKEAEVAYELHPVIVRADSAGVALNDDDREQSKFTKQGCPINKWIFDQLITKIDIPHIGGDLANGTIAISYVNKGINIALGLNVKLCDNLSILGGQQLRTYKFDGQGGFDWETMKIHLKDWISNLDQKLGVEVEIMNRMMAARIDNESAIDRVIGKLYQDAIKWRYFKGPQAPFDISGMSSFVQNALKQQEYTYKAHSDNIESYKKIDNVWDLYNWGTNVMKPEFERLENLTEASRLYADFLCNEFAIEKEDLFQEVEVIE